MNSVEKNPPADKNVFLMSLPRSGSTWLAERLKTIYGLEYFDEPLRTSFGNTDNPLYHSNILNDTDYTGHFFQNLDPINASKLRSLTGLNDNPNTLIKETTNLFQISFLKALLPNFDIIFLQRHIGGVLNSLVKVENVWQRWSLNERSLILRQSILQVLNQEHITSDSLAQSCLNQYKERMKCYLEIFERADNICFKGEKEYSQILAYLAVQTLEAKANIMQVYQYEALATNGIPNNILNGRTPLIDDPSALEDSSGATYLTHSTKNPSSPYAWANNYTDDDWDNVTTILDGTSHSIFPYIKPTENLDSPIVEMSFLDSTDSDVLSNRTVTSEEFEYFINEGMTKLGEEFFKKLGFSTSSTHTFHKLGDRYEAIHPDKPIVHMSPLSALAFSIYNGHTLPSKASYLSLQQRFMSFNPSRGNTHFGDYGKLKRISESPQIDGYYDLFGNTSEIAIDEGGSFFKIGGSYKDEKESLQLDNQNHMLWFQRDTETSFRMGNKISGISKTRLQEEVINIIKSNENPDDIHRELLELIKK